jgi:HlyD family secretion protein
MAEQLRGPFREKSLERLSSPERLDQLLRAVDRKSWLPLWTLAVLVVILVAWAVFGQVPVNVHGKGILVRPREVVEVQSPGAGYLTELRVRVDQVVEAGEVVGVIARPDLDKQLELQRAKARELAEQSEAAALLRLQQNNLEHGLPELAGRDFANNLEASRALAELLREKELQSLRKEREELQEQIELAKKLREALGTRLDGQRKLYDSGIISREALDDTEESHMEALARVSSLQAQLRQLRTRELEVEEQCLSRLQRIADREQDIADVNREIARLEHLLRKQGQIVSEHRGRILELSATVGEFLEPGARVGSMAVNDPASPLVSLTYFTVRDGKRLDPGLRIHVTPDTVERERFGSIVGRVTSLSAFPVTLAEAEKVVGNPEVAEALISGGYRMQVYAELERDPTTQSGFRWSSSRGPKMTFSAGTTTTARVAVDRRPPISFVLPFLKSAAGID